MGSICVLAPCPSPSRSKEGLSILQLVSFMLKRSHFSAFVSILVLVFRACCLKCLCALFSSSLFYSSDLLVLPRQVLMESHGGGADTQQLVLGCSLVVISRTLGVR